MRHFDIGEFDCHHTGKNEMQPEFLLLIDELRARCGFPFVITSGYRDPSHPVEAAKKSPGTHAEGIAADIKVSNGHQAYIIMKHAFELGFGGIAYGNGFVHVDNRDGIEVTWRY